MLLDISSALKNPGEIYNFSTEITINAQNIYGQSYFIGPVVLEGIFTSMDDEILVSGEIFYSVSTQCARCLKDITQNFKLKFSESFKKKLLRDIESDDIFDDECFYYDGYQIDISEMVEQIIITNIPIKMICKDGCNNPILSYIDEESREHITEKENPFNILKDAFKNDEEV